MIDPRTQALLQRVAEGQFRKANWACEPMLVQVHRYHAPAGWSGTLAVDERTLHLRAAHTIDELRWTLSERALNPDSTHGYIVFAGPGLPTRLPSDVLARVYGARLSSAGLVDALKEHSGARLIAPELRRNEDLVRLLLNSSPRQHGGKLNVDDAWRWIWHEMRQALDEWVSKLWDVRAAELPLTVRLLVGAPWLHETLQTREFTSALRQQLAAWIRPELGPLVDVIFAWARATEPATELLPRALATDAAWSALRQHHISERDWLRTSGGLWREDEWDEPHLTALHHAVLQTAAVLGPSSDGTEVPWRRTQQWQAACEGAEQLLHVQPKMAAHSSVLPAGELAARQALGLAWLHTLACPPANPERGPAPNLTPLQDATTALHRWRSHTLASQKPDRLALANDMHRLFVAWWTESAGAAKALRTDESPHRGVAGALPTQGTMDLRGITAEQKSESWADVGPRDLTEEARFAMTTGRFIDGLRERVERRNADPEWEAARVRLVSAVRMQVNARNARFAKAWVRCATDDSWPADVVLQEDVVTQAVEPLLRAGLRPLWIVLDGASWSVLQQLLPVLSDRLQANAAVPAYGAQPMPMLAMAPTVTEFARTSLLAGRRLRGTQRDEAQGLAQHSGLLRHGVRPRVFHRAAIKAAGDTMDDVKSAIGSRQSADALVVAVLNVVDEALSGSSQHAIQWNLRDLPALEGLLDAAAAAGRPVLLAADHGSVWAATTVGMAAIPASGPTAGTVGAGPNAAVDVVRMRPDARLRAALEASGTTLAANAGGSRWRMVGDEIELAVADDRLFGGIKAGTHGGLSTQEAVAPLVLLTQDDPSRLPGWMPLSLVEPAEWSQLAEANAASQTEAVAEPEAEARPGNALPLGIFNGLAPTTMPALPEVGAAIRQLETRTDAVTAPSTQLGSTTRRLQKSQKDLQDAILPGTSLAPIGQAVAALPQPMTAAVADATAAAAPVLPQLKPTTWGAALLENTRFAQRMSTRLQGSRDTRFLNALLYTLEQTGGRCSPEQIAAHLGATTMQVETFMSRAKQVFNEDGNPVLTFDVQERVVKVDRGLLGVQFGG